MKSSFSPYISVNLFSSTYKRLLLNFYSRVFVQTKILTHYINWLQGVHSPKPFPTIIPCTQVNRSKAMEFKITVQHPHSDQVDEYVLPVPTEGSRLCVNVTIDGANQRPIVAISCQQIVQAIQHTGPTHRSEPPPLVSIEDSDDSGSNTTVELVLNESDEDNNEYTDRRPTPWPLPIIHAPTQRKRDLHSEPHPKDRGTTNDAGIHYRTFPTRGIDDPATNRTYPQPWIRYEE